VVPLVGPGRSSRRCFPSILSPPGDPARRDLLRLAPARGDHHGDFGDAELPGGEHASMARNQPTVLSNRAETGEVLTAFDFRPPLARGRARAQTGEVLALLRETEIKRERPPKIKGRGRPTRSSAGRSTG